jgi:membrane protein DedA with SNARE-associated domain
MLSVLQSACVPTSSELTFIFGGFLAYSGHLSLGLVVLSGASGELAGAYLAWIVGYKVGHRVIARYGSVLRIRQDLVERLEQFYSDHSVAGVFASRLLPVVRNFVALIAGIAEVPALRFGILTFLGSAIWDGSLSVLGYGIGSAWEHVLRTVSDAGYALVGLLVIAGLAVEVFRRSVGRNRLARSNEVRDHTLRSFAYLDALARIRAKHRVLDGDSQG